MAITWLDEYSGSLQGKAVFCRVDYNVPLSPEGKVSDDERIRASLPTVQYLLDKGARVVLASHLGRPKGNDAKSSLAPVAERLQELVGKDLIFADDCAGDAVRHLIDKLPAGGILLLENLRFHSGEEKNDEVFAKSLAQHIDVYVNDAFGAAHRAHASVAGMVPHVPVRLGGLLLKREVKALIGLLQKPAKPFVAVLGGAKVSDKLQVLSQLMKRVDKMIVGGAMAYTFLKAMGQNIGSSRVEDDRLAIASSVLQIAAERNVEFLLPVDHIAAKSFAADASNRVVGQDGFVAGEMGLDIGPQTRKLFSDAIAGAGTVFWNGPMGVFEWDAFAGGTMAVMKAVASCGGHTVVGGGDSVAALNQGGMHAKISHVSSGGGASLELLEGQKLPGLVALGYEF